MSKTKRLPESHRTAVFDEAHVEADREVHNHVADDAARTARRYGEQAALSCKAVC